MIFTFIVYKTPEVTLTLTQWSHENRKPEQFLTFSKCYVSYHIYGDVTAKGQGRGKPGPAVFVAVSEVKHNANVSFSLSFRYLCVLLCLFQLFP